MDNLQLLDDLQQLLKAELSQTEQRIVTQLRDEIKEAVSESRDSLRAGIKELRTEMRDGFDGIAEIMTAHNDQLDDHETRLTRLEPKAA